MCIERTLSHPGLIPRVNLKTECTYLQSIQNLLIFLKKGTFFDDWYFFLTKSGFPKILEMVLK